LEIKEKTSYLKIKGDIMAEPVGRPTDYRPEFCQKVEDYLSTVGRENTSLPMVEGFAVYLGVSRRVLYKWSKEHKEFMHALEKIRVAQLLQLVDDGIYGGKEVNATIVKLMLQNNHGMKERKDVTSGDKPLPILDALSKNNGNNQDTESK